MGKSFEALVNSPLLEDGKLVGFVVGNETYKGKVVGLASNGLIKSYIIECLDGTFPNEIYPYKFLSLPISEIIY